MKTFADTPVTARSLRANLREDESQASRLALLQRVAETIAIGRTTADTLAAALMPIARHLSIDAVLVLHLQGGALTVLGGVGPVLPVGARVPSGGVLAEVTRAPHQSVLGERGVSRFVIGTAQVRAYEWLQPLRLTGRCHGVLVLAGQKGARLPDAEEQRLIASLSTLIAGLVAGTATAAVQTPRGRRANPQLMATMTRLTAREQQVLSLLPSGASNGDIAAQLGIAPGTAKIHVERILHKLGVRDRTSAAIIAADCGLRP